jgi:GDP-6-deoxy-D-talose 4-dehydrogenase
MRRALITGINGFTGRYVADELEANGWSVLGIGTSGGRPDPRCRTVDLTDAPALEAAVADIAPDAVIHLAAIANVAHGAAEEFYRVNLLGTRNLLSALAALRKPPDCVLLASSANIYGNTTAERLTEQTPPNPANDYAVSKLAMEYMAKLWLDRLPIALVRPFNYTGVGQSESFLLPKIVAHFRRRADVLELGNLDVRRDFSDVRAVAVAYRRLLEARPAGETVNICSGRTHSLQDVLDTARDITGHDLQVRVNPALVRQNEVKELCGDASRLQRLIGPWETPPLRATLQWMLS